MVGFRTLYESVRLVEFSKKDYAFVRQIVPFDRVSEQTVNIKIPDVLRTMCINHGVHPTRNIFWYISSRDVFYIHLATLRSNNTGLYYIHDTRFQ
mgnify:CR=1 FL=1